MGLPPGGVPPPGGGDGGEQGPGQFGTTNFSETRSQTPANPGVTMDPALYQQLNDKLASMADKMASILGSTGKLAEVLAEALKPLSDLERGTQKLDTDLKNIVNESDSVKDRFKSLLDLYKKTSIYQAKNVKSFQDMRNHLEQMKKQTMDISRNGFMSVSTQRILNQFLGQLDRKIMDLDDDMKKFGKTSKDAMDPHNLENYRRGIDDINRGILGLLTNTRKLSQTQRAIQNVRSAFQAAGTGFQLPGPIGEKYRRYAMAAAHIRDAKEARMAGNAEAFKRHRAAASERMKAIGRGPLTAAQFRDVAGEMATGAGGGGLIDRIIGGRVLARAAAGRPTGAMGRIVEAGGGTFTGGLGARLGGMIEGGFGGAAGMIGKAAPVFAGLEIIRDIFDKQTAMNKDVEKALAAGGILEAGGGGFAEVRRSLSPAYGGLGYVGAYSYQKNLKIAQAMVEAGLNVGQLAKGIGGAQTGRGLATGFAPGAMGTLQRNVYQFGRVAGLGEAETVQRTIKLLQQYRQSFTATEDFFIRLSKNAAAAGISTTKYLQILDEVTGGFDRLNKSFNESMNAMELLGRTGRLSADDLKDYIDVLAGAGKKVDVTTRAFVMREETPEEKTAAVRARTFAVGLARDQVRLALQGAGIQVPQEILQNLQSPEGIRKFKAQYIDPTGIDNTTKMSINSTLEGLNQALIKRGIAGGFASGRLNAISAAQATEVAGTDLTDSMIQTAKVLEEIDKRLRETGRIGPRESFLEIARKRPEEAYGQILGAGLGGMLGGLTPQDLKTYSNALGEVAESQTTALRQGTLPGGPAEAAEIYDKVFAKLKGKGLRDVTGLGPGEKTSALQEYAKDQAGELENAIEQTFDKSTLTELMKAILMHQQTVNKDEKAAEADKAARAERETRSTADMYANAFEYLFNLLWKPMTQVAEGIGKLVDLVEKKFGLGAPDTGPTQVELDALQMAQKQGRVDKAYNVWDKKLDAAEASGDRSAIDLAKKNLMELKEWRMGDPPLTKEQAMYRFNLVTSTNANKNILDMTQNKDLDGTVKVGTADQATGKTVINITQNSSLVAAQPKPTGVQLPPNAPTEVSLPPVTNPKAIKSGPVNLYGE